MRIAIAGGTGFIGEPLAARLAKENDVAILTRNPSRVRAGRGVAWDPPEQDVWADVVAAADVVINLAGENIGQRWTKERKARLVTSRVDSTNALVEAMKSAPPRQRTFINASAIGYYGSRGDEILTESAPAADDFLGRVAKAWEEEAQAAEPLGVRVARLRIGMVLGKEGGALGRMLLPFRLGVGGRLGSGEQWMSWIHINDLVALIAFLMKESTVRGVFNATSPFPATNREFTRALAEAVHRPAIFPVPAFALKMMFGEMSEVLLASQRAIPDAAQRAGFVFQHPDIFAALAQIAGGA